MTSFLTTTLSLLKSTLLLKLLKLVGTSYNLSISNLST